MLLHAVGRGGLLVHRHHVQQTVALDIADLPAHADDGPQGVHVQHVCLGRAAHAEEPLHIDRAHVVGRGAGLERTGVQGGGLFVEVIHRFEGIHRAHGLGHIVLVKLYAVLGDIDRVLVIAVGDGIDLGVVPLVPVFQVLLLALEIGGQGRRLDIAHAKDRHGRFRRGRGTGRRGRRGCGGIGRAHRRQGHQHQHKGKHALEHMVVSSSFAESRHAARIIQHLL